MLAIGCLAQKRQPFLGPSRNRKRVAIRRLAAFGLNGFKQFEEAMMAKTTRRAIWVLTAVLALARAPALHRRARRRPRPPSIRSFESCKNWRSFDALPEADRRGRSTDRADLERPILSAVVDGRASASARAIPSLAYQASVKAPADGVINAAQLAAMTGAAQKARAAVRFQLLTDEKTGVKIGRAVENLENAPPTMPAAHG